MKKRTIYITLFLIFIIGVISLIGTFAIDSSITEGNSTKADYLFNITLGDRTNREIVIPSYDSKIVDMKISNPNEFNMSYLLYLEGVNSNISIINIGNNEASGVLNSKTNTLIKVFIQNNSGSDITTSIKDIVGFENEKLSVPSNNTSINKGTYYKVIVKSNDNTYGKVKPNIKLSTSKGTVKYNIVPNIGYKYKSTTCDGTIVDNILTISNITSNVNCEVVFEPINIQVSFDFAGGSLGVTYTEPQEYTYTVPYTGDYKLETWGAQGGGNASYAGGYGGYASGNISLTKGQILYLNVGGTSSGTTGGYNGGGTALTGGTGGGGATHIATKSGLLSSLSSDLSSILMVSGGGGGKGNTGAGGNAGGISGNNGTDGACTNKAGGGATQTAGGRCVDSAWCNAGSFGLGGSGKAGNNGGAGGGGLYGGGSGTGGNCYGGGGGGSGYIGNSLLSNKYMYCYNCTTSDVESTKTYTTSNVSDTPTSDYTKSGNGAVKITIMNDVILNMAYNDKYGTLPTPTRDGYTFDGWYTEPDGKGTKITDSTTLTNNKNHTLYAYWAQPTEYTTSGSYTYTIPRTGLYKLETWGAQGGSSLLDNGTENITAKTCLLDGKGKCFGGYGSYTAGVIQLRKGEVLYLYVGGQGTSGIKSQDAPGGYNGGGIGTWDNNDDESNGAGGGASDVRLVSGEWNDATSLASRIMVAAGGGGASDAVSGLAGGGLTNSNITITNYTVSKFTEVNQVSGYAFGIGQDGVIVRKNYPVAGAGGGYYGGYSQDSGSNYYNFGAGGSSYISGHTGCVAITSSSDTTPKSNCTTGTTDNTCSVHYSNRKFIDTVMIDGLGYSWTNEKGELEAMPNPDGGYYDSGVGKTGDGAIKITFMGADTEPPTGTMSTSIDHNTINASIDATDNFGIDHYEYYLSTSSTCPTTGYTTSSSNTHSFVIKKTGTYYVCAKVVDGNNNTLSLKSDAIEITRIYSAAVRYNVNGGTISPSTGTYTWTTDSTGLIYRNGSIYEQTIYYGEPADLADYNNSNFINIDPGDLHVPSGGEWICLSGCSTADKVYNQATKYSTNDFCDVTNANCTVTMGLRLVSDTTHPTCTLSANGSNITAEATDDSGIAYQGWDSSYSGDNSTSKDIASGTHTYYVKDTAGNTNTCSISISGLVEKDIPYTETSAAYANYTTVYSGSCRCSKKATGGTSYVEGYCNPSSGCSCPGGTSISSNSCIGTKKVTGYYCPGNGTVSGSTCIYTKYKITYVCPDGYSGVSGNSNYCYKY